MSTLNVPLNYPTIQSAITASNSGDIIMVAAGTYTEQITIDKSLTLLGAQNNVDARTRGYIEANESTITYATPAYGTGIVNLSAQNIIFNGFTVQGTDSIVNSTSAIYAGDSGTFLPGTSTINVTGLQIIYNIIRNNANGVLIASIEDSYNPQNYLVQYNYLYNNSGTAGSGDGQGVFFNNSNTELMTNVIITQNLFNGLETNSSVNLANIMYATISNNVMNNDNSIGLFGTQNVTIDGNITYGSTGNAVYITNGCSNTTISNNLIFNSTSNGIHILSSPAEDGGGNSYITIMNNCIQANAAAGIFVDNNGQTGEINTNIMVNYNNIVQNTPGLLLNLGSYTDAEDSFNAELNYWNSASGPNYNTQGPGNGDAITDNNDATFPTVDYSSFLTEPISCPSPVTLSKTSTSTNVTPGSPVSFQLSLTVASDSVPFEVTSFTDPLPSLTGGSPWIITAQSPSDPDFFTLSGDTGSQTISISDSFPLPLQSPTNLSSGTYSVTLSANTNVSDAGSILPNTATIGIQIIEGDPGLSQDISASATASVAICIHGSSMIKLANGQEIEIYKLKPGQQILGADGAMTEIIEAIPCWLEMNNKFFGNCIIFEPNSLGDGVPSALFAVDPGHPICTPAEYAKNGAKALRPAKLYVNQTNQVGKYIYQMTWDATGLLLPGDNQRFDLVMKNNSCKAYIANGIVVQARQERKITGYEYE